jgi:hypothetical protein
LQKVNGLVDGGSGLVSGKLLEIFSGMNWALKNTGADHSKDLLDMCLLNISPIILHLQILHTLVIEYAKVVCQFQ